MTTSPLADRVIARLERAGFTRLCTPFMVASVRFDFTGVLQGSGGRSFDLVLIVDSSGGDYGDKSGQRTRQRIEALSRALDVSGSRLVLTAILVGAPLPPTEIEVISRTCRILTVAGAYVPEASSTEEISATELDDRLRILLPLELEGESDVITDPIGQVKARLPDNVDRATEEVLFAASSRGDKVVTRALADLLKKALQPGVPSS